MSYFWQLNRNLKKKKLTKHEHYFSFQNTKPVETRNKNTNFMNFGGLFDRGCFN